jgi:prophage regulatory protein
MRLLKRSQVAAKVGLERSAIYAKLQRGEFPKPIAIGRKSVRWLESDIDKWIAERVRQRDKGAGA